jgi:hypothetical protein
MSSVAIPHTLASAHVVLFGHYGDVTEHAQQRGVCRQRLYRETATVLAALDTATHKQQLQNLQQQLDQLRQQHQQLQQQLQQAVIMDRQRVVHFASAACAEGVGLASTRCLLQVLMKDKAPSVAQLGRYTADSAQRAGQLLDILDPLSRDRVTQVCADEIFVGRQPILMMVEPDSLCWVGGRLAERRDGANWAQEFTHLPKLERLLRDAGSGLQKGLELVNEQRQQQEQTVITDSLDHFHLLREGRRALRRYQGRASRALEKAEKAERQLQQQRRRGQKCSGLATTAALRWRQAEAVMDEWITVERLWQQVVEGIGLWTATGTLNCRAEAEAVVAAAWPHLQGSEWKKVRGYLRQGSLFHYLDRVHEQLAALPYSAAVRELAVQVVESKRRRPAAGRAVAPKSPPVAVSAPEAEAGVATAARVEAAAEAEAATATAPASAGQLSSVSGVVLLAALVGALGREGAAAAVAAVAGVLRRGWRSSSAVEGLNSVVRMHQGRHRRLTAGMLQLKRWYWNCRRFRTGQRKDQSPYERLGLKLPTADWWELLQMPPEQLRDKLSTLNQAA